MAFSWTSVLGGAGVGFVVAGPAGAVVGGAAGAFLGGAPGAAPAAGGGASAAPHPLPTPMPVTTAPIYTPPPPPPGTQVKPQAMPIDAAIHLGVQEVGAAVGAAAGTIAAGGEVAAPVVSTVMVGAFDVLASALAIYAMLGGDIDFLSVPNYRGMSAEQIQAHQALVKLMQNPNVTSVDLIHAIENQRKLTVLPSTKKLDTVNGTIILGDPSQAGWESDQPTPSLSADEVGQDPNWLRGRGAAFLLADDRP
jgi:hypothetical protein